jgi:hypothetical protein
LVDSFAFVPGNAEACTFLIVVPLMIFFNLLLVYLIDEPSKNFANAFCRLMFHSKNDESLFIGDFK